MKSVAFVLASVLLAGTALSAAAAVSPADAVKVRQANYKKLGRAFKGINDELKKSAPDKAAIKKDADELAALAQHIPEWFPPGSGPEAGVKTAAKAEIWKNAAEFRKDADALRVESAKLAQVAGGGDIAAIQAQVKATGAACGACHKAFREKDRD